MENVRSENGIRDNAKTVKLDSGLELLMKDSVMDDMELLDDLVAMDEGNGYAMSRVLNRMLLDPEEKRKLYDHLRKGGVTKVSDVAKAMREIFEKLGDAGKN